MDRQMHKEKKNKQVGLGDGHLSLSPVRRSPDLQARSTSFSKSVCKTEVSRVSLQQVGRAVLSCKGSRTSWVSMAHSVVLMCSPEVKPRWAPRPVRTRCPKALLA